jgi:hypothetical protein
VKVVRAPEPETVLEAIQNMILRHLRHTGRELSTIALPAEDYDKLERELRLIADKNVMFPAEDNAELQVFGVKIVKAVSA